MFVVELVLGNKMDTSIKPDPIIKSPAPVGLWKCSLNGLHWAYSPKKKCTVLLTKILSRLKK